MWYNYIRIIVQEEDEENSGSDDPEVAPSSRIGPGSWVGSRSGVLQ